MNRNILFTDETHFTFDGVNKTKNSHLWDRDKPHGNVESIYPITLSPKRVVWCHYQHDGAPPPFSQVVRKYLNLKSANRWIGRGGTENWPLRSPDLNPLDYHVWGYIKAMVRAHKLSTREELFQRILSTARSINNVAVLRKVTSSEVTPVRKCIQTDGGHFERLA